jgi:hypothetical protein
MMSPVRERASKMGLNGIRTGDSTVFHTRYHASHRLTASVIPESNSSGRAPLCQPERAAENVSEDDDSLTDDELNFVGLYCHASKDLMALQHASARWSSSRPEFIDQNFFLRLDPHVDAASVRPRRAWPGQHELARPGPATGTRRAPPTPTSATTPPAEAPAELAAAAEAT